MGIAASRPSTLQRAVTRRRCCEQLGNSVPATADLAQMSAIVLGRRAARGHDSKRMGSRAGHSAGPSRAMTCSSGRLSRFSAVGEAASRCRRGAHLLGGPPLRLRCMRTPFARCGRPRPTKSGPRATTSAMTRHQVSCTASAASDRGPRCVAETVSSRVGLDSRSTSAWRQV